MINVIGLGYIGLPTALMLASNGIEVVGTDYNSDLVMTLNNGKVTFKEDGLIDLFNDAQKNNIHFTTAYQETDVYIVSVPTPYDNFTKKVDASYIIKAVKEIMAICLPESIIIIESTVSPGTIDQCIRPLIVKENVDNKKIHLVHAPERIIPGNMLQELRTNNRTIGADCKAVGEKVKNIYASFCRGDIEVTDIKTAEMTKVVENTFRDINIAYANELAKICHLSGMDVYEIIRIANKHPRVNILSPGPGVGGHCISVDPWFLVGDYPRLAKIISTAREINDSMPEFVLERIHNIMVQEKLTDVGKVGFYGLTYKENVDDVRESPTLQILKIMEKHLSGKLVKIYDPYITADIVPNQYHDFEQFINDIEMIVILVSHDEIKNKLSMLKDKIIFDTRRISNIEGTYYL